MAWARMAKTAGIYLITCEETERQYVGLSIDVGNRWKTHLHQLATNQHPNEYLQFDFNKFGVAAFTFRILEICKKKELVQKERQYIKELKTLSPFGYNKK